MIYLLIEELAVDLIAIKGKKMVSVSVHGDDKQINNHVAMKIS